MIILIKCLIKLPKAIMWWSYDLYHYLREKWYLKFERWGLHLFTGKFGAGKTSTMVHYAYLLAKQYKSLSIMTNIRLHSFPKWTKIMPLRTIDDILKAPENVLVMIDEIGTIFNSRDFVGGKGSVPKILFQYLCQCRKRHMMIWGTVQRWNFLDKQLRDITDTVYTTRCHLWHPFSRLFVVRRYDAVEFDNAYSNPLLPLSLLSSDVYIQTDRMRELYSTDELIENMLDKKAEDFFSDEEIMTNRGEQPMIYTEVSKPQKRKYKKRRKIL